MTEFTFGTYRLLADVEATRSWYAAHGLPAGGCDCAYCRNFLANLPRFPAEVNAFLSDLGLELSMPGEAMEFGPEPDGRRYYSLLFHIAGQLTKGGDSPLEFPAGVTARFVTDTGPFLKDFPQPCFQLLLDARLPWALSEPDTV